MRFERDCIVTRLNWFSNKISRLANLPEKEGINLPTTGKIRGGRAGLLWCFLCISMSDTSNSTGYFIHFIPTPIRCWLCSGIEMNYGRKKGGGD